MLAGTKKRFQTAIHVSTVIMAHGCIISSEMNRLDKMSAIHPPLKKKTYLQKSFQLPAASFAVVWSRCEMDYYILELRHSVYFLHVNSSAPA